MARVRRLDSRQKAFVIGYYQGLDGKAAAAQAGYKDPANAARRLLSIRPVRAAVDRRIGKRLAGPREVLGEISEVATAPWRDFVKVKMDKEGTVVSARMDVGAKVRCLELLAKRYGVTMDPLQRELAELIDFELKRGRAARRDAHSRRRAEAVKARRRAIGELRPASTKIDVSKPVLDVKAEVLPDQRLLERPSLADSASSDSSPLTKATRITAEAETRHKR